MSSILVGSNLQVNILAATRSEHGDEEFFRDMALFQPPRLHLLPKKVDSEQQMFSTPWWPGPTALGAGFDGVSETGILSGHAGEYSWVALGANGRLGFVGYTRDRYGSPLGNCTVRCIRTATDELVSKVSSNENGFYIATTPYADGHFLVIHDSTGLQAGASMNSAVPA